MDWSECRQLGQSRWPRVSWPQVPPAGWQGASEHAVDHALARLALLDDGARAVVLERIEAGLRRWMSRTGFPAALADDAVQSAATALLAPPAQLAQYSGAGPLDAFLTVASARLALNLRRAERHALAAVPLPEGSAPGWAGLVSSTPELKVLRGDLLERLKAALGEGLASLPAAQRALLGFRYVENLEVDAIAHLLGVHRVTASRQLTAAREALRDAVLARLGAEAEVPHALRAWLGSRPELSLPRLLAAAAQGSTDETQPVPR